MKEQKGKQRDERGAREKDEARTREHMREDREMERRALQEPNSEWQAASDPPLDAPMSEDELRGIDLLGRASVRDGAIQGVGEPSEESGIDPPRSDEELSRRSAHRTNPPLSDDALGDGGISQSGGVAGGARGGAGTSSSGAGTPEGYEKAGPGEQKSTSRFDLDQGTLDIPDE